MENLVGKMGYGSAIIGFLLCAVAGVTRLSGNYHVLNFETLTVLQAGTALMVFACVIRLYFPHSGDAT
ncbi:MAG: hypothetical protein ACI88A_003497 [Paraglaciecola sp.]|jgi:hypothetical protein